MIDCTECPYLLRYLSLPDRKYGGRHWSYVCSKDMFKTKRLHFLRSLTRNKCKYQIEQEQKQLILVLDDE